MAAKKTIKKAATKRAPAKKAAPKRDFGPFMQNGKDWDRVAVMRHVCESLATSDKGLGQILEEGAAVDGKQWPLPGYSTIMDWLAADDKLSERYARAHVDQADWMRHDMLRKTMELSCTPVMVDGEVVMVDGKPLMAPSSTGVQLAKLYTDNTKWLMSKLASKKYGEATLLKHANADGDDLPPTMVMNFGGAPAQQ